MSSQSPVPKKLLSLDGGGVRGISSMVILLAVMNKVRELEQAAGVDDNSERLPSQYFDLAGGTSTGGLAALMLFRLKMSVSEVIDQYQGMAAGIFSNRDNGPFTKDSGSSPVGDMLCVFRAIIINTVLKNFGWKDYIYNVLYYICILLGCSQYSGSGLIAAVDKVARMKEEMGNSALLDDSKPKVLLFTTIHEDGSKGVMRSYTPPKQDAGAPPDPLPKGFWDGITLQQAARASTSAPFYFPPTPFNNKTCVDGGLLNNNPVERVWDARYELGTVNGKAPQISLVVSLGTAKSPPKPIAAPENETDLMSFLKRFLTGPGTAVDTFKAIIDLATNTEEPHRDFEQRMFYRNSVRDEITHYFRFNAEIDKDRFIELDDVKGMEGLKKDTESWLSMPAASKMVSDCARHLAKLPGKS